MNICMFVYAYVSTYLYMYDTEANYKISHGNKFDRREKNTCVRTEREQLNVSNIVKATEGNCHEISIKVVMGWWWFQTWQRWDLVSVTWVLQPDKHSHHGKICKEATAHMHITGQTRITPSYGTDVICSPPAPNMDIWNLDCKLSHFDKNWDKMNMIKLSKHYLRLKLWLTNLGEKNVSLIRDKKDENSKRTM